MSNIVYGQRKKENESKKTYKDIFEIEGASTQRDENETNRSIRVNRSNKIYE
jgi:hypothetical protein